MWYSVDLPNGNEPNMEHPKNAESNDKPRLYLLNVRLWSAYLFCFAANGRPPMICQQAGDVCQDCY